jgi:hypothetical protein
MGEKTLSEKYGIWFEITDGYTIRVSQMAWSMGPDSRTWTRFDGFKEKPPFRVRLLQRNVAELEIDGESYLLDQRTLWQKWRQGPIDFTEPVFVRIGPLPVA